MESIIAMIDRTKSAKKQVLQNMTVFPLLGLNSQTPSDLTLDQALGLEAFGHPDTVRAYRKKLIQSHALDAIDRLDDDQDPNTPSEKARRFLTSVRKSRGQSGPSIGLGLDTRFKSRSPTGAALIHDDRVLYLSALAKDRAGETNGSNFPRFSARRRMRH